MQQQSAGTDRPAKRQRLSLACNECRKRKVKCDSVTPKCKNCHFRGIACETTDPKHPELTVVRKYGGHYPLEMDQPRQDSQRTGSTVTALPTPTREIAGFPSPAETSPAPMSEMAQSYSSIMKANETNSWLVRSYRAQRALESTAPATTIPDQQGEVSMTTDGNSQHDQTIMGSGEGDGPEMAINTDNGSWRQKFMGGSSLQSLTMFLDLYLQRAGLPKIGPCFRHGMSFAEEFVPSLSLRLPDLPPASLTDAYLKAYTTNIHPMFPILEPDQLHRDIQRIRAYQDASWSPSYGFRGLHALLEAHDVPVLACIYGAISLGADEAAGDLTETGNDFLAAAHGLYAHLIGLPHLSSVQALLLITLALRARGKEGQGFQTLGSAVRISHSIGLHRHVAVAERSQNHEEFQSRRQKIELHARVWWTCFGLEKLMELETTRPSAMSHAQHDNFAPDEIFAPNSQNQLKYFLHWILLAQICEKINELLYQRKRSQASTLQLLQSIGRIDSALREWKSNLPDDIQPDGDIYCSDEERPLAISLALQYHSTLITLHRASLVLPHNQFMEEIKTNSQHLPYHQRLRKGRNLCTASACATIRMNAHMPDKRIQTPSCALTQTLTGCVVLSLSILRHPQSRTVRTDLELLRMGTEMAEAEYKRLGQHPKFFEACSIIEKSITDYVVQCNSRVSLREGSQAPRLQSQSLVRQTDSNETTMMPPLIWDTVVESDNQDNFQFDAADLFAGVILEDL